MPRGYHLARDQADETNTLCGLRISADCEALGLLPELDVHDACGVCRRALRALPPDYACADGSYLTYQRPVFA